MRIGAHESVAGGVSRAFARAEEHGGQALQLFTKSARGWRAPPLADEECARFRAEARRTGLPVIAHGSYLCNLATEDAGIQARMREGLDDELTRCERLGIAWLVLHPGSHPDEAVGLGRIARELDALHARLPGLHAGICLEVTAGQGNALGWRFEHLGAILNGVKEPERLSVCLDTCHLFAAGYDLAAEEGYEAALAACDRHVGLGRVSCLHLNDCVKPLGCRVDRHAQIGEGTIGLAPFRRLVNDPRFRDTPAVLETPHPERYGETIRLLQSLAGK